jgi:hypothetical protein
MSAPTNAIDDYRMPADTRELLTRWAKRAREAQAAQYEMANRLGRRSQWLGVPVIVITAIVGTSVFASISQEVISLQAKIAVGLMSVAATVLSSLQTFFKLSERAEKHRQCGSKFGAIRREIEAALAEDPGPIDRNYVAALREKLDRLGEEAPHVAWAVFKANEKSLREDARHQNA